MTADAGFVARHGLWDEAHHDAALQVQRILDEQGIELVRVSFPDQHGVLRGKTLTTAAFATAMEEGHTAPSTLLLKDPSHRTVYPVFNRRGGMGLVAMSGVADIVLVPDPTTFRVLPWAPRTAWVLCDLYFPDGEVVPFASRHVLRRALADLAARGYDYVTGLEVEFHVFSLDDPGLHPSQATQPAEPVAVGLRSRGYQLLSEASLDQLDDVVQLVQRTAAALDLPLRSVEAEMGPSQLEVTFAPRTGLGTADDMTLFRSAVKQVCRRHGLHATFMCRPHLPNVMSSGWHLHQSLRDAATAANAFTGDGELLSPAGRQFLGGLLAHALGGAVFATPTINGYKRYRPYSLAPDRVVWGVDNKGALLRVVGPAGSPGTRIENRAGESAANPYLYLAAQLVAGMDGLDRDLDPGPPTEDPYDVDAPRLPTSLMAALDHLVDDKVLTGWFGEGFTDYLLRLKRAEVDRFLSSVTDWEQREYFDLL